MRRLPTWSPQFSGFFSNVFQFSIIVLLSLKQLHSTVLMSIGTFNQIFLLADEIVRDTVLVNLSWLDLSQLDEALNNRKMRAQFYKWIHNLPRDILLSEATSSSFLAFIKSRNMKVAGVEFDQSAKDSALQRLIDSNLTVQSIEKTKRNKISNALFINYLQSLDTLLSIQFSGPAGLGDGELWEAVLKVNPNLQSLRLSFPLCEEFKIENVDRLVVCMADNCRSMKSFKLNNGAGVTDSTMEHLAQCLPGLQELILDHSTEITDRTLVALGLHCTGLTMLCLQTKSGTITDAGFVYLIQRCPQLTALQLRGCTSNITERSFVALATISAQLTELGIEKCKAFGSSAAEAALLQMQNLDYLHLVGAENISETTLVRVLWNNPKLYYINLEGIKKVTNLVVRAIAHGCPMVKLLGLSRCVTVSDLSLLGMCVRLDLLGLEGCTLVGDAALLQLANTPGKTINVFANNSGISAAGKRAAFKTGRICMVRFKV